MYNSVRSTAPIIMAMGIIYEPQKGAIPHSEANFSNNPLYIFRYRTISLDNRVLPFSGR